MTLSRDFHINTKTSALLEERTYLKTFDSEEEQEPSYREGEVQAIGEEPGFSVFISYNPRESKNLAGCIVQELRDIGVKGIAMNDKDDVPAFEATMKDLVEQSSLVLILGTTFYGTREVMNAPNATDRLDILESFKEKEKLFLVKACDEFYASIVDNSLQGIKYIEWREGRDSLQTIVGAILQRLQLLRRISTLKHDQSNYDNIETRDGYIECVLKNGDSYNGYIMNSLFHGEGLYKYANGDVYFGNYRNGQKHGWGSYFSSDGERFHGKWNQGLRNGKGTYYFKDGSKFAGKWIADELCSHGKLVHANGDVYIGSFKDNKYSGYGELYRANGDSCFSEWKNGKQNGKGTSIYKTGHKYSGNYRNGEFHGQAMLEYPDGSVYIGEFKNGKIEGLGEFYFADGESYIGEFKNGKFEGYGTFKYRNGDHFQGKYKQGKRHGHGEMFFKADGKRFRGNFKNDILHGKGKTIQKDGIIRQQVYKNGVVQSPRRWILSV